MTTTTAPQVALTRVFNAPRALVYRAVTDPEQLASFWGPHGNKIDQVEMDIRPAGRISWHETFPADPEIWTNGWIDLTEVVDGEVLDGIMHITGHLPGNFQPFETRMRLEFHDEPEGQTRIEVSQWLPEHLAAPTINGWGEQFEKLGTTLGL
jgi:uncharacterized protein YndB with AHSA1/START domain